MVLSGLAEVEVGDGERRTFGPGNVLLVTDTEGRGHLTNVIGKRYTQKTDLLCANVRSNKVLLTPRPQSRPARQGARP